MTMAHGICPTCQQEIRLTGLTPQRQVIAAHQFQGNKCEGSGSQSYEITRSSDMGSTKADAATWIPRVTTWIVVAAVCLLVLWLQVSCVARNISDGGRMDRAVAYICKSWVKAANEHT